MLKNIAIPLILGAAEAEAQKGDWLEEAMEGDRGLKFEGLIADEAACSAEADAAGIGAKATAEGNALATLEAAEAAVVAAQAAGTGAWALADAARKAAVEAAVAQEAAENIAGLLDTLDEKANLERSASATYLAQDTLYQAGVLRASVASARDTAAGLEKTRLEGLKTVADQAVSDANDQVTKETSWRQWRYCELGAMPAGDTTFTNWWNSDPATAADNSAPGYCTVPAVMSNADPPVTLRPAVKYYSSILNLAGGNDRTTDAAAWSLWTATLEYELALAAETATETVASQSRSKAAQIQYYTGLLKRNTFINSQRAQEKLFYDDLKSSQGAASSEITSEAETAGYARTSSVLGLGTSGDGAAKAVASAITARGTSGAGTAGRNYVLANVGSDTDDSTTWAAVATGGLDAWTTANATKGATYLWWEKAKDLSAAVADWHTAFPGVLFASGLAEQQQGTQLECDTTGFNSAIVAANTAACKAACQTQNNLLYNNPGAANGSALSYVDTSTTIAYCGGYSFKNDGAVCQLRFDSDTITVSSGTAHADSACFKIVDAKAMGDAQVAAKTAQDAYTALGTAAMIAATDAQAALEQTWVQAEWIVLYWAELKLNLTDGNGKENPYLTKINAALTALAVSNNTSNLNTGGATALMNSAASDLAAAEEKLIVLQSATAAATAVVTDLGKRIEAATAELTELATLVNADGTTGVLQKEAAARDADFTAITDGTNGEVALAAEELEDANAAVAVTTGALWIARDSAETAWTGAASDAVEAKAALTTALDTADLAALRATVEADTATWEDEQSTLDGLIGDVATAQAEYDQAAADTKDAITACQEAAYDAYRTTLERAMRERAEALKTIKALVQANEAARPAPGTVGARCEKALSNGTGRPQRGEQTCGGEGFCCGASRVWMSVGAGVADAAWRTIETCQTLETTAYAYQPARAPMDTTMPAPVSVGFTCIEGAKTLAAAASALAAAVYMLA